MGQKESNASSPFGQPSGYESEEELENKKHPQSTEQKGTVLIDWLLNYELENCMEEVQILKNREF